MSAIGRGLAVSAYALSTLLYHAEFAGLPPNASDLAAFSARAVGPSVPIPLLSGSPAHGGFGLLPVVQHTRARHAAMGARLVAHLLPHPAALFSPPASPGSSPPPQAAAVGHAPAPWVCLAGFLLARACPTLHPAQTLLAMTLSTAADAAQGVLGLPGVVQPFALPHGPLTRMAVAFQAVGPLAVRPSAAPVPVAGVRALLATAQPAHVVPQLGALAWARPVPPSLVSAVGRPARFLPALTPPATVRALTSLLMAPAAARRAAEHASFCRLALGLHTGGTASVLRFRGALRQAWRLPCPGVVKEPLWRLAIDAIPGGRFQPWCCPCGGADGCRQPRLHTFWECPVAQAVCDQLQLGLGRAPIRAAVWLLSPPAGSDVHEGVWVLVCLAAVAAMEHGRARLWALRTAARRAGGGGLGPAGGPLPPAVVSGVGRSAAAHFWHTLHDFVMAGPSVLPHWELPQGHPFVAPAGGGLRVALPRAALVSPGAPAAPG